MRGRFLFALGLLCALVLGLPAGCAAAESAEPVAITLSDRGSSCAGEAVTIEGDTVTIRAAGEYRLSGSLSDGQLVIDAPKDAKVRLILDGVTLIKNGHAAILALSADKLILESAAESENLIQSVGAFPRDGESKADGAVYARCDLTLDGEGTLNISCLTGHAVVTRDDLRIKGGVVNLEAALKGLYGKDSITVDGGVVNLDVGTDGLYTDAGQSSGKGRITVTGGVLNLLTQKDGLDASGDICIDGGELQISAGSGQEGKGLTAGGSIFLTGADIQINAVDDAVHAAGNVEISGSRVELTTGDDGVHADALLLISGGIVTVRQSKEGFEAQRIEVSGGEMYVSARNDGFNAAGGRDGSGADDSDGFDAALEPCIRVSGGLIEVNADGDGFDSNGSLYVSGGEIYISGPTNGANGALDYETEAAITGGTVIAVGTPHMAVNFGRHSSQGSILVKLDKVQPAGSFVAVTDSKGHILAGFEPEKKYSSVLISASGMSVGSSFTVRAGEEKHSFTLDELICGQGYELTVKGRKTGS